MRPGVPPAAQIDGRLKILHRRFLMAQVRLHDSLMIESFKVAWERADGACKMLQALYHLPLGQTHQTLSVLLFGFAGDRQLPHRNGIRALGGRRRHQRGQVKLQL